MISFVFLLLLFGAGVAALGLIVFAIVSKKLWIIPAAGGLVFLGLIALGIIGSLVVGSSHRNVHTPTLIDTGASEMSHVFDEAGGTSHAVMHGPPNYISHVSGPNWSRILIFAVMIAFIFGLVIRNGMSPAAGHSLRRAWPVIPVVIIFGLYFIRSSSRTYTVTTTPNSFDVTPAPRLTADVDVARNRYVDAMNGRRPAAEIEDARKKFVAALNKQSAGNRNTQQKHVEEALRVQQKLLQDTLAAQQKHVEATMLAQKNRVAELDIRAEMDQFDAPRIPVSSEMISPKAPQTPATPSASNQPEAVAKTSDAPSSDDKSLEKTNKDAVKKTAGISVQKRKAPGKKPDTIDTTLSQLVAQSKSEQEKNAKKEVTPVSDKAEMIAEAEPDKPKPRPAWVDEAPKRTGNTRREVIATDLYESIDECYQAADIYLLLRTYQRLQQLTGQPHVDDRLPSLTFRNGQITADGQIISHGNGIPNWADYRLHSLIRMGISTDYVRREIVAKDSKNNESREFVETVQRSFGPMKKLYLQIEFTSAVDRELRRHWQAYQRQERFAIAGMGVGSVIGLLGVIFALLKIDTWTKGYYTKRLFIGVPAAIIVVSTLLWADPLNMF